jgi:hypothetical protein
MAYVAQNTWWLSGPKKGRGFGGLGQTDLSSAFAADVTGSCPSGYAMENGVCTQYSCGTGYTYTAAGVCTANATMIPGIPDNYVYIGGGLLAAFLLLGAMKR